MTSKRTKRPVDILLVEDNPDDVTLTQEALRESSLSHRLHVASDGIEALDYLHDLDHNRTPDLVLLDLNLPKKDGKQVLREIKADPQLRHIPVVVLTTSLADQDVQSAYDLHANCYVPKPVDFDEFVEVVRAIGNFWFGTVKLPDMERRTA
jgi:two-component system response regulator